MRLPFWVVLLFGLLVVPAVVVHVLIEDLKETKKVLEQQDAFFQEVSDCISTGGIFVIELADNGVNSDFDCVYPEDEQPATQLLRV